MKRLLLVIAASFCGLLCYSQLLTWTPSFPTENNASQTLVITMDASKGNQGLYNYSATTDVYVHIGVITNKSTSSSDWKYVKFTWATTPAAANAVYIGNNKWTYTITGSLHNFFGITDATETIQKIAILFRNGAGDNSRVQRNSDGSDMYIPIYTSSLAVRLTQPPTEPRYVPTPEQQSWSLGTSFTISADANKPSAMKLYHNGTMIASASNVTTLLGTSTITAAGNQQVVAEANDGTTTKYDTINIFIGVSPVVALPAGIRDGINYNSGTSVTLVLRAPGKGYATVMGEFNNWTPAIMNKTPDGKFFWITLNNLTAGTEYGYQYVVDGTIKIADPYAEKILDPNNDAGISSTTYPGLKTYPTGQTGIVSVLQTSAPTYTWSVNTFNHPDKKGLMIYELLVRDFVAAHDWKTIQDSLNYLQKLGVNAIEVMPFNEFEGNNSWGYNPDFYFAPDKYYGPANTLKRFVDSCHRRGIAVIMDIALNHSFGSSPMVQLYWDAANNRPAANNPWFNPVPKHAYNVGYDMNHESADTKYYVGRIVEHWLQNYKLDGFRFDLAKGFTQKQTCDASGNNCDVNAWSAYDSSRVKIWKGYYDTVQNKSSNAYVILEHFAADNEEIDLSNYGMMLWGNMNDSYAQASMGYADRWDFSRAIHSVRGWTQPHLVAYAESHDEERIVYKNVTYGNSSGSYNIKDTTTALKRAEQTAVFLLTIPGPKMIWQFGELGYSYSINTCTNTSLIADSCRLTPKPIRWDYLNDSRRKNLYNVYSALNKLRFDSRYLGAFQTGAITRDFSGAFKWLKVATANDTADVVVIGNFDVVAQTGSVTFPTAGNWYDYFGNFIQTTTASAQSFTLQPGEYHVYVNRNVNNVTATPVSNVPWNGTTLEAKLYPNPAFANNTTYLEVKLPQSGKTTVELYNSVGQQVRKLYNGILNNGTKVLSLPALHLPAGTYFLKVQAKEKTKTLSLTLQ
ncbi:alpha-amylase family glycosyl hydrolase [Flavisolibacter ginsenosidimutans]|uniref:T9SS type A sorting domain-containing protein n=1 Tax=Flavisolibacter ginsenosidimutans TaxID=661481 RepID=A0A5B8ULS0_9BACT|nr:alpha-amylase family glycosyl hydrolase [Flavisolibacter ginsenosidimutans]QEC57617.1 T9SS type A sorting domain-containing protein [Flavisolibacter ginsenosidimutans]